MKKADIQVGVTYHNGKTGNRSYSSREVLEIGERLRHPRFEWIYPYGVRFKQVKGAYAGEENVISMDSFSQWAKGRVGEEDRP
ncbi:hypothetical protein [Paenibacillus sp. FSL R7-0333]|uniref:hypothetical protein n=1 Tax=Paenibacillus sp. FSL R7-0333 TaxID=1926587 RepID=UPI00096CEE4E|nr:hypothetical protein BK146_17890 [Paenibacillus sp. FSL R7-0333]